MEDSTPRLDLSEAAEALNKYYVGQVWRAASPVETDPPQIDENGNILAGIDWHKDNTLPKPSIDELVEKWEEIKATGEYGQSWPPIPGNIRRDPYFGTMSEYAQRLLESCDWAALPDTNLSNQAEWDAYRSALRDIRSNPSADKTIPSIPQVKYK